MTLLAFAGKCGAFGASGEVLLVAADDQLCDSAVSAVAPKPQDVVFSMSRRLKGDGRNLWQCMVGFGIAEVFLIYSKYHSERAVSIASRSRRHASREPREKSVGDYRWRPIIDSSRGRFDSLH